MNYVTQAIFTDYDYKEITNNNHKSITLIYTLIKPSYITILKFKFIPILLLLVNVCCVCLLLHKLFSQSTQRGKGGVKICGKSSSNSLMSRKRSQQLVQDIN